MEGYASFADLPTEIASHICDFLEQREVSRLSLTSKPNYRLIRPILYRCPSIESYSCLARFQRTITQATWMGKADNRWSTKECIDQTKSIDILIDPNRDSARNAGQAPAAILISRMIGAITRRCPSLDITLRFAHCRCEAAPISALEREEFPRVKRLILYVGKHDPEETHLRRQDRCAPSAKFFRPLVNGMSFPDLKDLEVRHYWATIPPVTASLEIGEKRNRYMPHINGHGLIQDLDGLTKLESIMLECLPELNSAVLMQLIGNPKAVASNLTTLDLRFCELDQDTLAQLLYHAPPRLAKLSLLCGYETGQVPDYGFNELQGRTTPMHLCPLIREFGKRLVHLEFSAACICRELFFDDDEIFSLLQNGISTKKGGPGGEIMHQKKLDVHAIQQTIRTTRQQKLTAARESRINEALGAVQSSTPSSSTTSLFGRPLLAANAESRTRMETEMLLDEEAGQRQRLISRGTKWFRRFITWQGLCESDDSWDEMQVAADMAESGIEWVLVNKMLQTASQHANGEQPISLDYNQALQENFRPESR